MLRGNTDITYSTHKIFLSLCTSITAPTSKAEHIVIHISINGVTNTLCNPEWKYRNNNNSFEYVISDMGDKLDIKIKGGDVRISDIEAYTLEPSVLKKTQSSLSTFKADISATHGDVVSGSVTAESDGILATSFTMHEGFKVLVDGKEVRPFKVNTAFLGFPIKNGTHRIRIYFNAPFLEVGKIISAAGILFMLILLTDDILRYWKRHIK